MSGSSRAIVLTLSVKDAEVVRGQLEQMGAAGETALRRLDAAATRTAGAGGLPKVKEEADKATTSFGGLRNAVQQGGYQLGDFVVQVQGGTSALTALSQQGSQFLGMFGPAGAVAGVVLSIGTIAASFLTTASNADVAKQKGQEALDAMSKSGAQTATVLREVNDLFLSAGQRAANLANIQRNQLRTQAQTRLDELGAGRQELARRLAEEEGYLRDLAGRPGQIQSGQGRSIDIYRPDSARDQVLEGQAIVRVRDLKSELAAADREAQNLRESMTRLENAGRLGPEELGPTSRDPFGVEALRASADKALKIRQDYEARATEIRAAARDGHLQEAEANRLIGELAKTRDEDLARLDGSAAASRRAATEQLAQMRAEARGLATVWETLRRDGQSGLLVGSENDVRQLREIRQAQKGTIFDPVETEKRAKEAERILKQQQSQAERATDDVVRYGADMFADMFTTTEGGWNRMWQNMRRTAIGIAARIAAEAVIRPVVAPVVGSLFSSAAANGATLNANGSVAGGSFGGLANGFGNLVSGAKDLWNSWGSGSVSAGLDTWGASNLSSVGFSSASSTAGLLNGGSALGGFSALSNVAGIAGSALPGLMSGNYVQAGLGVGGAALGTMILPGVGTVIGGIAGNLLGGLFGGGEKNPAGSVQLGTDANGQLIVQGSKSKNYDMAEALQGANSTVGGLNTALSTRGLSLNQGMDISQIHYGKDANKTDQQDLVRSLLSNITGGTDSVMSVIARELAKGAEASLETAFSDIDWVKGVYDPLNETKDSVSAFQQSVDAIMGSFDAAKARAEQLGLATDGLVQKQLEQVFALQQQRAETIWGMDRGLDVRRMRAGGQNEAADLLTFDVAAIGERASYRANLESLGQSAEDVTRRMLVLEETLGAERLSIVERYAEQAKQAEQQAASSATGVISSLADYARSLSYGDQSPLGASEQLMLSRNRFQTQRDAALAGDASALSGLQSYSQEYLGAARSLYGSGEGYASAYAQVMGALEKVGELTPDTLTASFLADQTQTQTQTLVEASARLEAIMSSVQRELQMANSRPRAA